MNNIGPICIHDSWLFSIPNYLDIQQMPKKFIDLLNESNMRFIAFDHSLQNKMNVMMYVCVCVSICLVWPLGISPKTYIKTRSMMISITFESDWLQAQ